MNHNMPLVVNNDSGLPLILSHGFPTSIHRLSEAQLECYLKYLYEFTDVPKSSRVFPPRTINPRTRIRNLKTTIRNVYDRLGARYLLHLSESIALKSRPKNLSFQHSATDNMVNIYDTENGIFLVSVPRSNLTYDLGLSEALKFKSQISNASKSDLKYGITQEVISLDDSEDEEYQPIFKQRKRDPLLKDSKIAPSSENEVILISDSEEISDETDDTNPKRKSCTKSHSKIGSRHLSIVENYSSYLRRELILLPTTSSSKISRLIEDKLPDIEVSLRIPQEKPASVSIIISDSDEEQEDPLKTKSSPTISNNHDHQRSLRRGILLRKPFRQALRRTNINPLYQSANLRKPIAVKGQSKPDDKKAGVRSGSEETPEEKKAKYLNSLGLFALSDLPDDPIILPEFNKKDFVKFHRLPLNIVTMLASKEVIKSSVLVPGLPGQDSKYTSTAKLDLSKLRSSKLLRLRSSGRHRSLDYKNARDYVFPRRTYRTTTPVPTSFKRSKPGPLCSKKKKSPEEGPKDKESNPSFLFESSDSSCEGFVRCVSISSDSDSGEENSETEENISKNKKNCTEGSDGSPKDGLIVKPCSVKLLRLNPFIEKYYFKIYRENAVNHKT